jgi:hypothetical protein
LITGRVAPGSFAPALFAGALLELGAEGPLGVGALAEAVVPVGAPLLGKTSAELGAALARGSSRRVVSGAPPGAAVRDAKRPSPSPTPTSAAAPSASGHRWFATGRAGARLTWAGLTVPVIG